MRHAKSFVFRAGRKIPLPTKKWDCHAPLLSASDRAISRLFSIFFIAGENKNGRAKFTRWSAKFTRWSGHETTKGRKDDTNIHVLNWGGKSKFFAFPTPKMGIKQIEQFSGNHLVTIAAPYPRGIDPRLAVCARF